MWEFGDTAFFRDTQIPARFLIFDSKVAATFMLFVVHMRIWTAVALILFALACCWIEWRGMRVENAVRRVRSILAGKRRLARGPAMRRGASDMAWECSLPPEAFAAPAGKAGRKPARAAAGRIAGWLQRAAGGLSSRFGKAQGT